MCLLVRLRVAVLHGGKPFSLECITLTVMPWNSQIVVQYCTVISRIRRKRVYTTLAKEADPSEEPGPADGTTVHVCQVHPAQASQLTVGTVDETHEYQWIKVLDHFNDNTNGTAHEWLKKKGLPFAALSL